MALYKCVYYYYYYYCTVGLVYRLLYKIMAKWQRADFDPHLGNHLTDFDET